MPDRIAQHDQFLAMAQASLTPERTFIVFTFPPEGSQGEEPRIFVSAHAMEVEWAIDRLLESLLYGEIQARVQRFREFLDRDEPDPE